MVCRDNPIPDSTDVIQAALGREKSADVAAVLQSALERVRPTTPPTTATEEAPSTSIDLEAELGAVRGRVPKFIDMQAIPAVTDLGGTPLSDKALKGLVLRLKQETPDFHDAHTVTLAEALNPDTLDALGAALLNQWSNQGRKASHKWVVYQLAVTASKDRLATLAKPLGHMVSSGGHARAGWTLDVFARHRSTEGASWIYYWLQRAATRGFRTKARAAFEAAVTSHGAPDEAALLEQLDPFIEDTVEDRQLDDLGLGDGLTVLSYGARHFTPALNAHGAVVVVDDAGQTHAELPQAEASDQASAVKASTAALEALRGKVQSYVERENDRFVRQMIVGRAWTVAALREGLGANLAYGPLLAGIVFRGPGGVWMSFHNDHGRDVEGNTIELAADDVVAWAHPADMTDAEINAWQTRLDPQPFDQLNRPIVRLDHSQHSLTVTAKPTTASKLSNGIHRLGYRTSAAEDAGMVYGAERRFPERGIMAVLDHSGYPIGMPSSWREPVTINGVSFTTIERYEHVPLQAISPAVTSELAIELKQLGITLS
ncbi:MAG: DUF4132 domain-containing protein [Myxococcota bacterium]